MATTSIAHMSEEQLTKVFHDGLLTKFKTDLRQKLLSEAEKEIDGIVEDCAKHLVGKIHEYRAYDCVSTPQYLIRIDGVDKIKGTLE